MRVLKSLSVERPNRQASVLWGNVRRLVVVVTECEGFDGSVIVYGVDPEHMDPTRDGLVFEPWMPSARLDAFLARLQHGDPAPFATGTLRTMPVVDPAAVDTQVIKDDDDPGTIDYPSPRPPTTGPKLHAIFSYVQTLIATSERRGAIAVSRTSTGDVS